MDPRGLNLNEAVTNARLGLGVERLGADLVGSIVAEVIRNTADPVRPAETEEAKKIRKEAKKVRCIARTFSEIHSMRANEKKLCEMGKWADIQDFPQKIKAKISELEDELKSEGADRKQQAELLSKIEIKTHLKAILSSISILCSAVILTSLAAGALAGKVMIVGAGLAAIGGATTPIGIAAIVLLLSLYGIYKVYKAERKNDKQLDDVELRISMNLTRIDLLTIYKDKDKIDAIKDEIMKYDHPFDLLAQLDEFIMHLYELEEGFVIIRDEGDPYPRSIANNAKIEELKKQAENSKDRNNQEAIRTLAKMYEDGNKEMEVRRNSPKMFEYLIKLAEIGDLTAKKRVANAYATGEGLDINQERASNLYKEVAKDDDDENVYFELAKRYEKGIGIDKNENEANKWYAKAAEAQKKYLEKAQTGDGEACWNLAVGYANGLGVQKNEVEASRWYLKAAEAGDEDAYMEIAKRYQEGIGIQKDEVEASRWYLKAAEAGDEDAYMEIAKRYQEGIGVEKNEDKAKKWRIKANQVYTITRQEAEGGNIEVYLKFAEMNKLRKDNNLADKWYLKAAQAGDEDAYLKVAESSYGGKRTWWYKKAAEAGKKEAYYELAKSYEFGWCVPKDEVQASKWYLKAAEEGVEWACGKMAKRFKEGIGVDRNLNESNKWSARYEELRNKGLQGLR